MTEPDVYACPHVSDKRPRTAIVTFQSVPPSRADLHTRTELCAICAGRIVLALQACERRRESVYAEPQVIAVLRAAGDAERALWCATCNHAMVDHTCLDGGCVVEGCACPGYA